MQRERSPLRLAHLVVYVTRRYGAALDGEAPPISAARLLPQLADAGPAPRRRGALYPRAYRGRAYFERFATGVECYLNGDWVWAREYLVWCYAQNPADRPAVVLLEYMAAKRFAAPKGWLGCRRDDYEDDAGGELRV